MFDEPSSGSIASANAPSGSSSTDPLLLLRHIEAHAAPGQRRAERRVGDQVERRLRGRRRHCARGRRAPPPEPPAIRRARSAATSRRSARSPGDTAAGRRRSGSVDTMSRTLLLPTGGHSLRNIIASPTAFMGIYFSDARIQVFRIAPARRHHPAPAPRPRRGRRDRLDRRRRRAPRPHPAGGPRADPQPRDGARRRRCCGAPRPAPARRPTPEAEVALEAARRIEIALAQLRRPDRRGQGRPRRPRDARRRLHRQVFRPAPGGDAEAAIARHRGRAARGQPRGRHRRPRAPSR